LKYISALMRTTVVDPRFLGVWNVSGIALAPCVAFMEKNGPWSMETPSWMRGAVVFGPRLTVRDERSWTLSLNPDPDLEAVRNFTELAEPDVPPRFGRLVPSTVEKDQRIIIVDPDVSSG
jgi:hypothetical protein